MLGSGPGLVYLVAHASGLSMTSVTAARVVVACLS
jgi:hypothetical protein